MEILLNKDAKKSELETEDEGTGGWRMFKKLTKNFSKDVQQFFKQGNPVTGLRREHAQSLNYKNPSADLENNLEVWD